MNQRWLLWTVRISLLVALGVSTALLIDYSQPTLEFCSVGSGCDSVRRSGLGYIPLTFLKTYVPLPVFGLLGFGLTFAASLLRDWQARRRWSLALGAAGAFVGLGLILTQWLGIGAFCLLCVVVDAAAIVAAGAGFLLKKQGWQDTTKEELGEQAGPGLKPAAWALLAALSVLAPWLWPKLKPMPPVPAAVAALYQPGKINVVEFADFECPHCRRLHQGLKQLMAHYPGEVNFVRRHMPLPRHEDARPAARAAICADRQRKEAAVADALFESDTLDGRTLLEIARREGLDLSAFKACLADPTTDRVIDEHSQILRDSGFQGLPTTFVGSQKIVGAQPEAVFREAFDKARAGGEERGVPGGVYWPLAIALGGACVWMGRLRPRPSPKGPGGAES